ncbi:MAG TPA: uroporphyrinogen decarboxylase family protein [Spirochaetia bacterium]|nr:uroporphyrinogen decarboxylase family protein [Spirochaetia bacterium]
MNARENMIRAVEFRRPERLPICFETLGMDDLRWVGWNQIGTGDHEKRETLDEWGCLWVRSAARNMGQVKGHPLESWDAASSYRWPDPADPSFFQGMERKLEGTDGYYRVTSIFMLLFERMHSLHGFQNTLMDLALERSRMEELADRIVEFDLGIIEGISRRFPGAIDGFNFTDDWGTENALFIDPRLWDDFFKPRYKRIFDACHAAGWHVWMHSCGKVNAIIPGLIEIGVNVLNLQQPRALGIEAVGKAFAGKVAFSSLCDIQKTLPTGSEAEIREEASLLLRSWGTEDGGFVLSDYGDGVAIGAADTQKRIMLDAFLGADRWRKTPAGGASRRSP